VHIAECQGCAVVHRNHCVRGLVKVHPRRAGIICILDDLGQALQSITRQHSRAGARILKYPPNSSPRRRKAIRQGFYCRRALIRPPRLVDDGRVGIVKDSVRSRCSQREVAPLVAGDRRH